MSADELSDSREEPEAQTSVKVKYRTCASCLEELPLYANFRANKNGQRYADCNECFIERQKEFWKDKTERQCKRCCALLKIATDFEKDAFGNPLPNCKECRKEQETEWANEREERAAKAKQQYEERREGGVSRNNTNTTKQHTKETYENRTKTGKFPRRGEEQKGAARSNPLSPTKKTRKIPV